MSVLHETVNQCAYYMYKLYYRLETVIKTLHYLHNSQNEQIHQVTEPKCIEICVIHIISILWYIISPLKVASTGWNCDVGDGPIVRNPNRFFFSTGAI
jgi:hypothetical protein